MYVRYDGKEHRVKMATNTPLPGNARVCLGLLSQPPALLLSLARGQAGRVRNASGDTNSSMGSLSHADVSPGQPLHEPLPACAEPSGVDCPSCGRKFKNMPALNGHMRLHSTALHRLPGCQAPAYGLSPCSVPLPRPM